MYLSPPPSNHPTPAPPHAHVPDPSLVLPNLGAQKIDALFHIMDLDGNGQVSKEEMLNCLVNLHLLTRTPKPKAELRDQVRGPCSGGVCGGARLTWAVFLVVVARAVHCPPPPPSPLLPPPSPSTILNIVVLASAPVVQVEKLFSSSDKDFSGELTHAGPCACSCQLSLVGHCPRVHLPPPVSARSFCTRSFALTLAGCFVGVCVPPPPTPTPGHVSMHPRLPRGPTLQPIFCLRCCTSLPAAEFRDMCRMSKFFTGESILGTLLVPFLGVPSASLETCSPPSVFSLPFSVFSVSLSLLNSLVILAFP
jgi:hypothetical protein